MSMDRQKVIQLISGIAKDVIEIGPGFAQEQIVLRKVADALGVRGDLKAEQFILTCWNEMFLDRTLSWGYNIENPSRPWFHFTNA